MRYERAHLWTSLLTEMKIGSYSDQAVCPELVRKLLLAAMAASSAGDQRPWHFVVVEDQETRERMADILHPFAHMLPQAPVAHPRLWRSDAAETCRLLGSGLCGCNGEHSHRGASPCAWSGVAAHLPGRRPRAELPQTPRSAPSRDSLCLDAGWLSRREERAEVPLRRVARAFRSLVRLPSSRIFRHSASDLL